jgi:lipopolysaccharide export system permease protein
LTLSLYLLRRVLSSFGFALAGILLLVLPAIAVQAVNKLGNVGIRPLLEFLPLVFLELAPYLLPMAFLLGVVASFGRLAGDNEWTAIRMSGIHPLRVFLPSAAVAVVLALFTDWVLASLSPEMKYKKRDYIRHVGEERLRTLGQGLTEIDLGDFYLKFESKDPDDPNRLREVILSLPVEDEVGGVLIADAVRISFEAGFMVFDFENAQGMTEDVEFRLEHPRHRLPLEAVGRYRPPPRHHPSYRTSADLRRAIAAGEPDEETVELYRYEVQARHALAATYLIFLLLGAPTGLLLRSGTHLGAISGAIGYAFLYYILSMRLGKELAVAGALAPAAAAWATDALFVALGVFLFRRSMRR